MPRILPAIQLATTLTAPLIAEDLPVIKHHLPGPIHEHHTHAVPNDSFLEASFSLTYDSRYVSEGRDNLDGDSLVHGSLEFSIADFLFTLWLAESPQSSYNEFNLGLEYGIEIGSFELYAGYNHLRFPELGGHDHEFGAGFRFSDLPLDLVAIGDGYYSFDASGSFFEMALVRPFSLPCGLTLEPGVVIGANVGYIPDGHHGANHLAATMGAVFELSDRVELNAYLSYNWALDSAPALNPGDGTLADFFYGGLSTTFSF